MWLFSILVKDCRTAERPSDRSLKSIVEIFVETVGLKVQAFEFIALGKTTRVAPGQLNSKIEQKATTRAKWKA